MASSAIRLLAGRLTLVQVHTGIVLFGVIKDSKNPVVSEVVMANAGLLVQDRQVIQETCSSRGTHDSIASNHDQIE